MKKLIFLFLGFFCFAHSQIDSVSIAQKLIRLDQETQEVKADIRELNNIRKENKNLIYQIKIYIQKLKDQNKISKSEKVIEQLKNTQGIKAKNINEPIIELDFITGYDSIRGNFFYRLFHKEKIYLRAYKIFNDEKIYLD